MAKARWFSIILFSGVAMAQAPCKPSVEHRKLDQQKIQNTQVQKVNSWKEEWRMDPKKTAQHEAVDMGSDPKRNPDTVPVTFVRGDDRTQVYSFRDGQRTVELTMKKPEWLLPYSGIYKIMMWVVTDVKTTCAK